MTNPIANWWRCLRRASLTRQFHTALKLNNNNHANQLLEEIQQSGARLSLLEKVFQDKLQSNQYLEDYKREVLALRQQVGEALDQKQEVEQSLEQTQQAVESLSRDKQQAEQSVVQLHEELRQNRQEATLVRQQLGTYEQHIQDLRQWRSEACEQQQNLAGQIEQKQREVENLARSKRQVEWSLTELRQKVESLHRQLSQKQQESAEVQQQLEEHKQQISKLREQLERTVSSTLVPHPSLLEFVSQAFNFNSRLEDPNMLQCTGIDEVVFGQLEGNLVDYLQLCLRESSVPNLKKAYEEIRKIRSGQDPDYSLELMDFTYLIEHFLNNVYCNYIAWFLIYESNLLKQDLKILDIAAGPGTVLQGLAAFLESLNKESINKNLSPLEEIHICYHWLEQQKYFQDIGAVLWQQSTTSGHIASNSYWRLDNSDFFKNTNQLPSKFFDFIIICHCFFWNEQDINSSFSVYNRICQNNLRSDGYALFIVQQSKLFNLYKLRPSKEREQEVVENFIKKMGLSIEWFKCLSSTGIRGRHQRFREFAEQNLILQKLMSPLKQQYFRVTYNSHYNLDDYVILARKKRV